MQAFRDFTPVERAILAGRARQLYALKHPETARGHLGISQPRTVDSPKTFKVWASEVFSISSPMLYRSTATFNDLGEPMLRDLINTNLNAISHLQRLRKLTPRLRYNYIRQNAQAREKSRTYLTDINDYLWSRA